MSDFLLGGAGPGCGRLRRAVRRPASRVASSSAIRAGRRWRLVGAGTSAL